MRWFGWCSVLGIAEQRKSSFDLCPVPKALKEDKEWTYLEETALYYQLILSDKGLLQLRLKT